jgi:inorganic triphosphatase YgiF
MIKHFSKERGHVIICEMLSNNIETEAKFIIPDLATFEVLQELTRLGDFEITPLGPKKIADRYLDTADRRLYQAGLACRIRKVQDQQLLTLKTLTPASGGVHRRQEIELVVDSDQPGAWADGEARDLVLGIIGENSLNTLFTLYQTRHKYHVHFQEQRVIELSLDKVSLDRVAAVDYLGLEAEIIETGTEADLTHFVETLQQHCPLKVDTRSKFERALATRSAQNSSSQGGFNH